MRGDEWWWQLPPEPVDAGAGAHLFVCQHGLWGSPEDVAFLEQYLQHNGWLTLNARSNSARCTFDGADVCGDRLAAEVVNHVQRLADAGVRVTHISFAAYSFGGLIARYAAGKLLSTGFLGSVVEPVNFLTIATPHLGCWEHPNSMSHLAYNSILPWTLSRTGRQLLLADRWLEPEGLPLLAVMARPEFAFHAALAAFRKRVLLADIRMDRTVPYTTASICAVNPYLPQTVALPLMPPQQPQRPPASKARKGVEGAAAATAAAVAAEDGGGRREEEACEADVAGLPRPSGPPLAAPAVTHSGGKGSFLMRGGQQLDAVGEEEDGEGEGGSSQAPVGGIGGVASSSNGGGSANSSGRGGSGSSKRSDGILGRALDLVPSTVGSFLGLTHGSPDPLPPAPLETGGWGSGLGLGSLLSGAWNLLTLGGRRTDEGPDVADHSHQESGDDCTGSSYCDALEGAATAAAGPGNGNGKGKGVIVEIRPPSVIPLPISSAYPCIVMPHAAPPQPPQRRTTTGFRRRPPHAAGAEASQTTTAVGSQPSGMRRTSSSPLPNKAKNLGFYSGSESSSSGSSSSERCPAGQRAEGRHDLTSGRQMTPTAPALQPPKHLQGASYSSSDERTSPNEHYRPQPSHGQHNDAHHQYANRPPGAYLQQRHQTLTTARSLGVSSSGSSMMFKPHVMAPSATAMLQQQHCTLTGTSAGGITSSSGSSLSGRGGGFSMDAALSPRVRLGLFIALLPVLLSLWLCMVAWLAGIWIHHYAVLLTVRPDRSWDVRMGRRRGSSEAGSRTSPPPSPPRSPAPPPQPAEAVAARAKEEEEDEEEEDEEEQQEAPADDGTSAWDAEFAGGELVVTFKEPPPLPPSPSSVTRHTAVHWSPAPPGCRGLPDGSVQQQQQPCPAAPGPLAAASVAPRGPATADDQRSAPAAVGVCASGAAAAVGAGMAAARPTPCTAETAGTSPEDEAAAARHVVRSLVRSVLWRVISGNSCGCGALMEEKDPREANAVVAKAKAETGGADPVTEGVTEEQVQMVVRSVVQAVIRRQGACGRSVEEAGSSNCGQRRNEEAEEEEEEDAAGRGDHDVRAMVRKIFAAVLRRDAASPTEDEGVLAEAQAAAAAYVHATVRSAFAAVLRRHYVSVLMASAAGTLKAVRSRYVGALVQSVFAAVRRRGAASELATASTAAGMTSAAAVYVWAVVQCVFAAVLKKHAAAAVGAVTETTTVEVAEAEEAEKGYVRAVVQSVFAAVLRKHAAEAEAQGLQALASGVPACISAPRAAAGLEVLGATRTERRCCSVAGAAAGDSCRGGGGAAMVVVPVEEVAAAAALSSAVTSVAVAKGTNGPAGQLSSTAEAARGMNLGPGEQLSVSAAAVAVAVAAEKGASGQQQQQQEGSPPHQLQGRQQQHDPAVLLAEMIADLNLLEWQKVDVDTQHYHAHAAIVIRSSRRFRSHLHIIEYAVRQLRP